MGIYKSCCELVFLSCKTTTLFGLVTVADMLAAFEHYRSIALQMEHSFSFLKLYMKVISHREFAWI